MKIKPVISSVIACLLLTGCSQSENTAKNSPKIDYSDLFKHNADANPLTETNKNEYGAAAAEIDSTTNETSESENAEAPNTSANKEITNRKSNAANNTTDKANTTDNAPTNDTQQGTSSSASQTNASSKADESENAKTPTATIGNRKSSSVIYVNEQTVADLPLGDICYFPYKTDSELKPPNANVVSPKEPNVTNGDNNSLKFTAGISQSTADKINKLSDSDVKNIQDVVKSITAEAPDGSGLDNKTKLYAEPNSALPKKSDNKTMFLGLTFQNDEGKEVQPQKAVKVTLPVPSELKNSTAVNVYFIGKNNTPEKLNAEIQTVDGAKYAVFETSSLGSYAITGKELKKTDVDKFKKDAEAALQRKEKVYDYGYRAVFRTETDTYLLGIFPYNECEWNEVNDMCLEIGSRFKSDCQMVGAPSLKDLDYFTKCGIYLPGQYEMWTSTPTSPTGNSAYYRNRKGAYYSTKNMSKKCGVCAIIRVSTQQNDPDLLSSFLPDYETTKLRLEEEEKQYNLSLSE